MAFSFAHYPQWRSADIFGSRSIGILHAIPTQHFIRMPAFHQWLKAKRRDEGLVQDDVADHLHCSQPTYNSYERGRRLPPLQRILLLAELYGETPEQVIARLPRGSREKLQAKLSAHRRKQKPTAGTSSASPSRWSQLLGLLDQVRKDGELPKDLEPPLRRLQYWLRDRLGGGVAISCSPAACNAFLSPSTSSGRTTGSARP